MHDYRRCPMDGQLVTRVERVWGEPGRFYHRDGTYCEDNLTRLRWSPGPSSILELAKASSPYTVSMDKLAAAMSPEPYRWGGMLAAVAPGSAYHWGGTATAADFREDVRRILGHLGIEVQDDPEEWGD